MPLLDWILAEVSAERDRQRAKWGDREGHPSLDPTLFYGKTLAAMNTERAAKMAAERYEIPTAKRAQHLRERAVTVSWAHIVVEELCESIEAACRFGDGELLRAEIVQTMASLAAWLEDIERREL